MDPVLGRILVELQQQIEVIDDLGHGLGILGPEAELERLDRDLGLVDVFGVGRCTTAAARLTSAAMISRNRSAPTAEAIAIERTTSAKSTVIACTPPVWSTAETAFRTRDRTERSRPALRCHRSDTTLPPSFDAPSVHNPQPGDNDQDRALRPATGPFANSMWFDPRLGGGTRRGRAKRHLA
jgi:hypothetical protein